MASVNQKERCIIPVVCKTEVSILGSVYGVEPLLLYPVLDTPVTITTVLVLMLLLLFKYYYYYYCYYYY